MLTAPAAAEMPPARQTADGMSWVTGAILLMFCVIALRFRNNSRYVKALLANMTDVRERNNAFDDTVRETAFLVMLNILWVMCAGVILWPAVERGLSAPPVIRGGAAVMTSLCCVASAIYSLFMAVAYGTVGTVFTDAAHARMWVKANMAGQALLCIVWLPVALMIPGWPEWTHALLWTAAIAFIIAKTVFIWKGFRIFFIRFSSWVLFLYYLCSLEIVPLILTYWGAVRLCGAWAS